MQEYVVTLPVYLVIYVDWNATRYLPLGGTDEDWDKSVAIFTEELFAERARDKEQPRGVIWRLDTVEILGEHLNLFEAWGVRYVAFDPLRVPPSFFPKKTVQDFRREMGA